MLNRSEQWPTLKRLLGYGQPYRRDFILATAMLWLASAAEVGGPLLVSYFIDHFLAAGRLPLWRRGRCTIFNLCALTKWR